MQKQKLSRRSFIQKSAGFTFVLTGVAIAPQLSVFSKDTNGSKTINAWVRIDENGEITIYNPASEMGQGSMTACAVIIAEELDADWDKVNIEYSPIDPSTYGLQWGGKLGGPMITVGSRTVRGYLNSLRIAGAQAKYVLMHSASKKLKKDISELKTELGWVIHKQSGKKISYGELSQVIEIPESIPEFSTTDLKDPKDFRLIGKMIPRADIPAKVNGSAKYSIDISVPGMVYAAMQRSPVHGSKPTLLNQDDVSEMNGVLGIVELDHGIAVVADTFERALKAKKELQIKWSEDVVAADYDSQKAYAYYQEIAELNEYRGTNTVESLGDTKAELQNSQQSFTTDFKNDFVYHSQMEPLNAVVSVSSDGKSAEAWVGSQAPDSARRTIAETLNIDFDDVKFHPCYLGGGFGRRSLTDYVEETAIVANNIKKPVKLIWTREDDVQYGAFRPICYQRMQAAIDDDGYIKAWRHWVIGTGDGLLGSGARIDYYDIPNKDIQVRNVDHGVRTKHWRSVGHGPNKYAIETFIDQIAHANDQDPVEYRRYLMRKSPRELNVVNTVAKMANWGENSNQDRAKGIAFAERSGALTAGVAEISVDKSLGKIIVHKFWVAMDAGIVVQPDNAIAQLEGGVLHGLSSVFYESITFKKGKVQQSNFHDYPLLRFAEIPESLECQIIESSEAPAGIGEASLPVVGGAIANAFMALTGKTLDHMPFTSEKILEVLQA